MFAVISVFRSISPAAGRETGASNALTIATRSGYTSTVIAFPVPMSCTARDVIVPMGTAMTLGLYVYGMRDWSMVCQSLAVCRWRLGVVLGRLQGHEHE